MPVEYKKKPLVTREEYPYDPYPFIVTEHWSNLLDAAMNNTPELKNLINEASDDDIKKALSTLEMAYSACTEYTPYKSEYAGFGGSDVRKAVVKPDEIMVARGNLLCNLIHHPYYQQMNLSEADKRAVELKLQKDIDSCNNIEEILSLYKQHVVSSILENRRHPYYDKAKTFLYKPSYNKLKQHFIEALQSSALKLMKQDPVLHRKELERSLFSPGHTQLGVSKSSLEEFTRRLSNDRAYEMRPTAS